jgi:sucrose phosphorylase
LRALYGAEDAERVANAVDELLDKYRKPGGRRTGNAELTEKDVLLITYGDTLVDDGTPPLEVLRRFYRDFLAGIFNLVHVLPFHPYSSDDGFSVIDYYAVRDDLGDWSDIKALAQDCRVMVDAVINHVSSESEWFRQYLAGNPEYEEYFIDCDPAEDLSAVTRPRTSPLLTEMKTGQAETRHLWTTFSADQVDLNYRSPAVLVAVLEVLFHLVDKGARLLRLDAVTFLWKEPGTSCANLPQTHELIKIIRSAVFELRPDVVIVTETNVPHRENVAYFGDGSDEAHMVYNFALPPLLAHSFITGDSSRITEWARQIALPGDETCFLNFSASHDGVGVRPVEEILDEREVKRLVDSAIAANGLVSSRTMSDGREHPYELNCTFLDLISVPGENPDATIGRFIASQAIVLAMPGVPAIYIQSLLGTRNDQGRVRETGIARSINRSRHEYAEITARLADDSGFEARIYAGLKRLIGVRSGQTAFDPYAPFRILDIDQRVFAIERGTPASEEALTCIVNLTGETVSISVGAGMDVLNNQAVGAGAYEMLPYAVLWMSGDGPDGA